MGELILLSNDLNVITAEINSYKQVAGHAIWEIGRRLKHVKESKLAEGRGGWSRWLEEEARISINHANKYVEIVTQLDGKYSTSNSNLGVEALYLIATMSDDMRNQQHTIPSTGESKTVDEMTVKELREVKKANKELESQIARLTQEAAQAKESAQTAINEKQRLQIALDTDREVIKQEAREAARKEFEAKAKPLHERIDYLVNNPLVVDSPESKAEITRLRADLKHAEGELERATKRNDEMSEELDKLYEENDVLADKRDAATNNADRDAIQAQIDAKDAEIEAMRRQLEEVSNPRNVWGMLKEERVVALTNETHTHTIRWAEKIAQMLLLSEEGAVVDGIAASFLGETIGTIESVLAKLKRIKIVGNETVIETVSTPARWAPKTIDLEIIG